MIWLLVGCSMFGTTPDQNDPAANLPGGCWDSSPTSCEGLSGCQKDACEACASSCDVDCHTTQCDSSWGRFGCPSSGEDLQIRDYCVSDSG